MNNLSYQIHSYDDHITIPYLLYEQYMLQWIMQSHDSILKSTSSWYYSLLSCYLLPGLRHVFGTHGNFISFLIDLMHFGLFIAANMEKSKTSVRNSIPISFRSAILLHLMLEFAAAFSASFFNSEAVKSLDELQ